MKILFFFAIASFCSAILIPNHYLPWLTFYQDSLVFMSLMMLGCASITSRDIFITKKIVFFIFFLVCIVFLQYMTGKIYFFGDMLLIITYLWGFLFSIMLGLNLTYKFGLKNNIYYFSMVIIFCSIISVFIQLKQWLLLHDGGIWIADLPPNGRPFANFAQPNNCATFLGMGIMASLYLYEEKHINKIGGCLLTIYLLFGLSLTQSRTLWIFAFIFLFWWFCKKKSFTTRLNGRSALYFFIIYILIILIIPYFSNYLGVVSTSNIIDRVSSGYLRIPMWNQLLIAIYHEPWFGYGWNQVSIAQISVYLEYPTHEWIEHSHNIILDLLIWNGLPLGVIIVGCIGFWLYGLSKLVNNIQCFTALSMVGVVLVHSMLEYPLEYAFFLFPIGFLLGVVQSSDEKNRIISLHRNVLIVNLLIALIIYIWIYFEYREIEKDVQLLRFEVLNIGELHANHDAPDIVLLNNLREQTRLIRTRPVKNMTDDQLESMRKVTYRYATPITLYRYSQALALNNKHEEAKKYLLINNGLHGRSNDFESLFKVHDSLVYKWESSSNSR